MSAPTPDVPAVRAHRAALAGLTVLLVVAGVLVLWSGRGTTPYADEWDWLVERGHSVDVLLGPHNGHLSVVPKIVYEGLLQVVGLAHHWVFRLVLLGLHLLCGVLVFAYARRRVGDGAALAAATLVLFLGAGAQDVLWAFQIGFMLSVTAGLGTLLALDRETRRGDLAAAGLLTVSLGSSGLGIVFLAGAVVELTVGRRAARAWVAVGPAVLYGLWSLGYGESQTEIDNVPLVPTFGADMGSAAVGGLVGLGPDVGRVLLVVGALAVGHHVLRARALTPRAVAVIALPLILWSVTGLSRADLGEPFVGRYVYPGAVLVLLLTIELARGRSIVTARQGVVAAAVVGVAIVGGLAPLRGEAGALRHNGETMRAQFGAVLLLGDRVPAGFVASPRLAPQVTTGALRDVVHDHGSIAMDAAALARARQDARTEVDGTLVAAGAVPIAPAVERLDVGEPPPVSAPVAPVGRRGCVATAGPGAVEVAVRPGDGVAVRPTGTAELRLRRFGDGFPAASTPALDGRHTVVRAWPDRATGQTWRLQVSGPGPVELCGLPGAGTR